jgi:hypothetical protein
MVYSFIRNLFELTTIVADASSTTTTPTTAMDRWYYIAVF